MTIELIDLRCPVVRTSGVKKGVPCRYLLCRVSSDIQGVVETKCPRCGIVRQWAMGGAQVWGVQHGR